MVDHPCYLQVILASKVGSPALGSSYQSEPALRTKQCELMHCCDRETTHCSSTTQASSSLLVLSAWPDVKVVLLTESDSVVPINHNHAIDIKVNNQHFLHLEFAHSCLVHFQLLIFPMHQLSVRFRIILEGPHLVTSDCFSASQVLPQAFPWSQCKCISGHLSAFSCPRFFGLILAPSLSLYQCSLSSKCITDNCCKQLR